MFFRSVIRVLAVTEQGVDVNSIKIFRFFTRNFHNNNNNNINQSKMVVEVKHLKAGDSFPTIPDDGKLQLLSMRFCPFAQRIHIVLEAKKIPYHTINVNLTEKPEWIKDYSPLGKVPALGLPNEPGKPWIYESLIVADYLDEKYPEVPLYPKDPVAKTLDRLWIEQFSSSVWVQFYQVAFGETKPGALTALAEGLDKFEGELKRRGTLFYGGAKPNMLDYMIWPFVERLPILKHVLSGDKYEMDKGRYPKLIEWNKNMIADPAVKVHYLPRETHFEYIESRKAGAAKYDLLFNPAKKPRNE